MCRGVVEVEAAVIRLVGARVLGSAFWLIDADGGLNAAANAVFAGRRGRFVACLSCRNAWHSPLPWAPAIIKGSHHHK